MIDWSIVKQKGNRAAVIAVDPYPLNPRTEFEHACTMHLSHRRYDLGDEHEYEPDSLEDLIAVLTERHDEIFWQPVSAYVHDGITIWISDPIHPQDPGGWDTGLLGIIYITRAQVLHELGLKRMTKRARKWAYDTMAWEVTEYDMYLTGEVYGIGVATRDEDDEVVDVNDTCWGCYGYDFAKQKAIDALEACLQDEQEVKWEQLSLLEVEHVG